MCACVHIEVNGGELEGNEGENLKLVLEINYHN